MNMSEATRLINNGMAFWENWRFRALPLDATTVYVDVEIDTVDTSYPDRDGVCRREKITLSRGFMIEDVHRLDTQGICYQVLKFAAGINEHEDREALKVRMPDGSWEAPLHPHTDEGNRDWRIGQLTAARRGHA